MHQKVVSGSALGHASETTPPPPLPGPAVINIIPLPRPPPGRSRAPSSLIVCGEQGWPLLLLFPPPPPPPPAVTYSIALASVFLPLLLRGPPPGRRYRLFATIESNNGPDAGKCVCACVCVCERESDPTKMSWNESVNASSCRA